jgi:hypothetical protein
MLPSLIATLKRHARRLRTGLPPGSWREPMPRMRWYS